MIWKTVHIGNVIFGLVCVITYSESHCNNNRPEYIHIIALSISYCKYDGILFLQSQYFKLQQFNKAPEFFENCNNYWKPASDTEGLYQQLSSKKYREILRQQIQYAQFACHCVYICVLCVHVYVKLMQSVCHSMSVLVVFVCVTCLCVCVFDVHVLYK